jgi:hypothetical protein
MGKAIRTHLSNGKVTYCGIAIHKELPIAVKGELFFESKGETIRFNCLCKNCVSIMVKQSRIYRGYIERVKYNESIVDYENKLPKTIRAMKYYCAKRKLNWNKKNTNPIDKLQLQAKPNPIPNNPADKITNELIKKVSQTVLNQYVNTGNQSIEETAIVADDIIELTEEVNPIAIGEKTEKGIKRELRKSGVLPYIKKVDKTINRIQNEFPIAMVKGFGNNWKVIEEFSSMGNCNSANVKELTGWVPIAIAQKVYNQYVINRVME